MPQQKRVQASAAWERPSPASPASSIGSSSGIGSSPTTSWLRLRSTASASRSPNAVVAVGTVSRSCTIRVRMRLPSGPEEREGPREQPLSKLPEAPQYYMPPIPAPLFTACLSWLPAENLGTVVAGICTRSEGFLGLTPWRAARRWVVNLPNPVNDTSPPERRTSVIESRNASTASEASRFERPALSATLSTNSCFVTCFLPLTLPLAVSDPNSQAVSAQPCGFAAVFSADSNSPARNSGTRRAPGRA